MLVIDCSNIVIHFQGTLSHTCNILIKYGAPLPQWNSRPVIIVIIVWQTEWHASHFHPHGMIDLSLLSGLYNTQNEKPVFLAQMEWQTHHCCYDCMTDTMTILSFLLRLIYRPVIDGQASMTELWLNAMAMNNIPVNATGLYTQWI